MNLFKIYFPNFIDLPSRNRFLATTFIYSDWRRPLRKLL